MLANGAAATALTAIIKNGGIQQDGTLEQRSERKDMSKHICDEEHIAYLLASAMQIHQRCAARLWGEMEGTTHFTWIDGEEEWQQLRPDNFRETGQMLLDRNVQACREGAYAQGDPPGERVFRITGAAIKPWIILEPVEIISAAHGYELNSQGDGWKGSIAERFIRTLVRMAISELPGYQRASPGVPYRLDELMTLERKPEVDWTPAQKG